ncbi:MAG TPA: endonuclease/exonuclease/phosphatase family protein, partial [Longimicrobiaceae bacterium]|nr:endonuclease/exonuclease/phosphatase family protein [Longimicrobiaceae bacterium]
DWVEQRERGDSALVRLRTVEKYRSRLEEPGRFLVLPAEEITQYVGGKAVHVNATNLAEPIPEQRGSKREILQADLDAVRAQRERTGRSMIAHVNHPNFLYSLTAEDLIATRGLRFFELYNAHPLVHNEGDELHPGTERIWDIVLAERLSRGGEVLYGLATDDAHDYHRWGSEHRNPGRGWVMVRAPELTPEALIAALEAGDFYASTGVELEDVRREGDRLSLRIRPEPGVTYTTRFIGTRRGYDPRSEPRQDSAGTALTSRYSEEIGEVLAEVEGTSPNYQLAGDELYVRARVVSSKAKENPPTPGEVEVAWTQPWVISPGSRAAASDTLSVVTLNIWHDQRDWPARLDYMVRELRRLNPDVIALQEVLQHDSLPNQAETIARRLGYDYYFTSVDPADRPRRYGNAILTRHPVLARNWKALAPLDDYRNAAHLRIAVGGREIDVYDTHLHHTGEGSAIRREQLEDLLGFIRSTRGEGPVIVAGDFNAPVEAPEMRLLDERFLDAYGTLHTDPESRARTTLNPHVGHE